MSKANDILKMLSTLSKNVETGFDEFLSKLTPTTGESEAAKSHRASILQCLNDNFEIENYFQSGSFGNGTSIAGFSDVDRFVCISTKELPKNSRIFLNKIYRVINNRFPRSTVKIRRPAIVIPFGRDAKESTDIIPAIHAGEMESGHSIYDIPNFSAGWMESYPEAHTDYVRETDKEYNGRVRPLIRFIKAWKYYCKVPISSFYLELQVVKYVKERKSIVYDWDITRIFQFLRNSNYSPIEDPFDDSNLIEPFTKKPNFFDALANNRDTAKNKLNRALNFSEKAVQARDKGDNKRALHFWNIVFNGNFPKT